MQIQMSSPLKSFFVILPYEPALKIYKIAIVPDFRKSFFDYKAFFQAVFVKVLKTNRM